MKRRIVLTIVLWVFGTFVSHAQEKRFGLGIIFGEPTGFSGKAMLSERNAIDAGVAWSFRSNGRFHLHADYLWQFPHTIKAPEQFTLFAGIGGRLAAGKGDGIFGIRIVGGVAWLPRNSPLEIFLEVAPILDMIPATELSANGGVGVRFFF